MISETQTPPRRRMSFFANSFDLNPKPQTTPTPASTTPSPSTFFERHPPSEVLLTIFLHIFAPNAFVHTTSAIQPYSNTPFMITEDYRMIVDDDYVMLEEERREKFDDGIDGGPLCREAVIEKWKSEEKGQEQRQRKMSFHEGVRGRW